MSDLVVDKRSPYKRKSPRRKPRSDDRRKPTPIRSGDRDRSNYTLFKSKSGEIFSVRTYNIFHGNLGNVLGGGKAALVVEDIYDKTVAYKIFKNNSLLRNALYTHQLSVCINVAPEIYGVDDNVIKMQRVKMLSSFPSNDQQRQLVALVARMVSIGLLHNDLHLDHIGVLENGTMVLIDFGQTQNIGPLMSDTLFLQVVMAQLYALIDPCNFHNIQLNGSQCINSPIISYIYSIRAHHEKDPYVATLLNIREETAALFNSSACENSDV